MSTGPALRAARPGAGGGRGLPRVLRRVLLTAAVLLVLLLVFAAYLRPQMLFAMANQLWACF